MNFPEIINFARYYNIRRVHLRYEDKEFYEMSTVSMDNSFFQMFSFPFVKGDMNTALLNPNSIVIDETTAQKYFGNSDPIGKPLHINDRFEFTVSGVIKDVPSNSDIQFTIVLPWSYMKNYNFYREDVWDDHLYNTFIMLDENASGKNVEKKIINIFNDQGRNNKVDIYLQPLSEMHLYPVDGSEKQGNIIQVYILSIIAIFILLIACINFINLSTARSRYRSREVGMRKVVGGTRKNLIRQFYSESFIISFISFLGAIIVVLLILPAFNNFAGKQLSLNILNNRLLLILMFCVTIFTGLGSGSYPAFYLSSFKPVDVLKGTMSTGIKKSALRRLLVIFQFVLSIIIVICTLVVYTQLDFMLNMNLGWEKENLFSIEMGGQSNKAYNVLKNKLMENINIEGVSAGYSRNTSFSASTSGIDWAGKDPKVSLSVNYNFVDYDFIETSKLDVVNGRSFSKDFTADTTGAFIINETLANRMGIDPLVGASFKFWNIQGRIIGVVKDFHFQSLRTEISPLVLMRMRENSWRYLIIRIKPENRVSTLAFIEDTWKETVSDYPFEINYMDNDFASLYRPENRIGILLKYSAILMIFITCLGLFGLVSFTVEKRKKEIGIRKVLGATIPVIIRLISKEFFILIAVSNLIAWPVSYFIMNQWLNNFAYRMETGISIFLLSGISTLFIALLTISLQAVRAATANPVDSLKYE